MQQYCSQVISFKNVTLCALLAPLVIFQKVYWVQWNVRTIGNRTLDVSSSVQSVAVSSSPLFVVCFDNMNRKLTFLHAPVSLIESHYIDFNCQVSSREQSCAGKFTDLISFLRKESTTNCITNFENFEFQLQWSANKSRQWLLIGRSGFKLQHCNCWAL